MISTCIHMASQCRLFECENFGWRLMCYQLQEQTNCNMPSMWKTTLSDKLTKTICSSSHVVCDVEKIGFDLVFNDFPKFSIINHTKWYVIYYESDWWFVIIPCFVELS